MHYDIKIKITLFMIDKYVSLAIDLAARLFASAVAFKKS
jgi:hypothetical protein